MRIKLSTREIVLLIFLGVAVIIAGYVLFFYRPVTDDRDRCLSEAEDMKIRIEAAQLKLQEQTRMEKELEVIRADENALSIPNYDNQKPVMNELNSILMVTDNYSLKFGKLDASSIIVRRSINISYTANDYENAISVLHALNDNNFRCMLGDIGLAFDKAGRVSVSGSIIFFEYRSSSSEKVE